MLQKVTDSSKIVTDGVVLRELARQNIDKDYVEFCQDYAPRSLGKGHSPYAKFYRDLKSGKKFMVASGLPKVKPDGKKIEVGFTPSVDTPAGKYRSKANLFLVIIDGKEVSLTCLSDQPYGAKALDQVVYQPQLFLNNNEVLPVTKAGILLETDPVNENYHNNVLIWNYGICIRRIRIIEGRFRERWLFYANPNGNVRIKHNQSGSYKLKLGEYAINDDEEFIPASIFNEAEYPFEISASATYYPDAGSGNATVDGYAREIVTLGETWANILGGDGVDANDTDTDNFGAIFRSHASNNWWYNARAILVYDASGLPDGCIKSAATLSVRFQSKADTLSTTPDTNVYSSAPANNNAVVGGDYNSLGTTPFCDTPITYANWVATWIDFAFNQDGIDAISKTVASPFGMRSPTYDVGGTEPNGASSDSIAYLQMYTSDQGAGYKPKLVVTYLWPMIDETVGISEGVVILKSMFRIANESVNVTETLSRRKTILKIIAETLGITEHTRIYLWWILRIVSSIANALKIKSSFATGLIIKSTIRHPLNIKSTIEEH